MPYTVVTSTWTGAAGLPGYTKIKYLGALTTSEAATAVAKSKAFFDALLTYIPAAVRVAHGSTCDIYDDNQEKTGIVTAGTGQPDTVGTASGAYAQSAGAWMNLVSTQFVEGRRVVGRIFLVPLGSTAFQSDGTLITGFITALTNAGNTLITGFPNLVIPYRRRDKQGNITSQGISNVAAVNIKDKSASLRSRRD